jgi:hypothetical protein
MTVSKSKRPAKGKSSANPTNYSQIYKQSEQNMLQSAAPAPAAAAAKSAGVQRSSEEVDWKTEYGFVFKDLRHLLILSAVLFAGIIIIGFFL